MGGRDGGSKDIILIVEDDDHLRRLLVLALNLGGFATREARDGLEALHIIDREPPALVILDLVLPGIDGVAVRHEISAHVHTRNIPILVVTGTDSDLTALSASCVLRKPVAPDDVVAAVAKCLVAARGEPAG